MATIPARKNEMNQIESSPDTGAIVRYALSIPEVRAGVRRRLKEQGKLPQFSREEMRKIVSDYLADEQKVSQ